MTTDRETSRSLRRRRAWHWLTACAGVASAVTGVAVAQYRVNTQANAQVNRQIYGNTSSSVRYGRSYQPNYGPQTMLLPSENRNLIYRSGALPSTIRMNAAAIGPMAPQGVAAYVPEPQSFRSAAVTPGNYVNTASPARVTPMPAAGAPAAPRPGVPGVPGPSMPPNPAAAGSMRYAIPAPGSVAPPSFSMGSFGSPAPVSYSKMVSGTPVNWTPQTGSIKFSN